MILFAKLVSLVFHPAILILILPFLVVYKQTESSLYALKWLLFSAFFVSLAGILVFFGEKIGVFSDADLTKRNERYKFYISISILALFYIAIVVYLKGITTPLAIIAVGALIGVFLFALLNHFFKISMHSGVVCAFVISVFVLYGVKTFFSIVLIAPLTIWARIVLGKHTLAEAISGGLLGGMIALVTFLIGKLIINL